MKRERNYLLKKMYIFISNSINIIALLLLFQEVWFRTFNDLLDRGFIERGNLLMFFLYAVVTVIFFTAWGGFKLGYNRLLNVLLSQMFALVCSNLFLWMEIVLLVAKMHEVKNITLCIMILTVEDALVCLISTTIFSFGHGKLFKPWQMLEIDGEIENQIALKIKTREDKYQVCERISVREPWEVLSAKMEQYEAVLLNEVPEEFMNRALKHCYEKSIRVYFTPRVTDIIVKGTDSIHLFDSPLLLSKNVGLTYEQAFIKRCFDLVVATVALVLTLPIFVLTALAIKLTDGGPVFFCQKRCTINGNVFSIYKFRSMVVQAEKEGEAIPATSGDERVTKVGRFLRAWHIDELPQLFNVLKGEMSIVGPRPERVEHVEKYAAEIPEFVYRMKVKGGLTGYAQVYGKYNTSPYDKLKMDLQYIVDYSILLDIQIILETFKIFFKDNNKDSYENLQ